MNLKTKELILVALFAALTAVGAFIKIPIPYVPFTLQYLFCAFSGILLGARLGTLSQVLYVAIGLLGIPVFTEGGGLAYIFKPTFGYLIGFIIGAYIIGKIVENIKNINFIKIFGATLSGLFFIYLFGLIHLYIIYNLYLGINKSIGFIFFYGFVTCIGGDIVITIIVAITAVKILSIARKNGLLLKVN